MLCGSHYTLCLSSSEALLAWGGVNTHAGPPSPLAVAMGAESQDSREQSAGSVRSQATPREHRSSTLADDAKDQNRLVAPFPAGTPAGTPVLSVIMNSALTNMAVMGNIPVSRHAPSSSEDELRSGKTETLPATPTTSKTQASSLEASPEKQPSPGSVLPGSTDTNRPRDLRLEPAGDEEQLQPEPVQNSSCSDSHSHTPGHWNDDLNSSGNVTSVFGEDLAAAYSEHTPRLLSEKVTVKQRGTSARSGSLSSKAQLPDRNILLSPHELQLFHSSGLLPGKSTGT